jgi:hypothetical protein
LTSNLRVAKEIKICFTKRAIAMDKNKKTSSLMHDFSGGSAVFFTPKLIIFLLIVAIFGISSGFLLAHLGKSNIPTGLAGKIANGVLIPSGKTFGSNDTVTFKDIAEGVLKMGGVDGEGQYHLERTGGESQNVYLTSSDVDLSQFIDRKIKVWGQTQTAQTAGWLMIVGRVEVR